MCVCVCVCVCWGVGGIHLIKFSDNCLLRGKHEWLSSKGKKDSGFQKPDVLPESSKNTSGGQNAPGRPW